MTKTMKTKTKKRTNTARKSKLLQWTYDEEVTMEEFIRRIEKLVCGPVRSLHECEGDMMMSDYRKLSIAFWRLTNAVERLDGKT